MLQVRGTAYRILGYLVWKAAKWYLRRRLPLTRTSAVAGVAVCSAVAAAVLVARRRTPETG
jgi:uncharacterized membrane protein (GlpM family)